MLLDILSSIAVPLVITILGLLVNSHFQRRNRDHDFSLTKFSNLEEENKELRKTNFSLQQKVLESEKSISILESKVTVLVREKDEVMSKVDTLTKDLLTSREREFKLYTELEVMKKQLREFQDFMEEQRAPAE